MGWSAWITPDPYVFAPVNASMIAHPARYEIPDAVVGDTDAAALVASYVDTVQAGGGTTTSPASPFTKAPGFFYGASKQTDGSGNITVSGSAELTQFAVTLDGSGHAADFDWFPALLSTLVEGVDYGVRPDRTGSEDDAYVEYDSGDVTVAGWQDWPVSTTQTDQVVNTSDATVSFPSSWTVRFAAVTAIAPVGDHWAAYTDGTTLDTATLTVDTSTQNSGTQYDHSAAWSHTVAMGGVGAVESFTLLMQPSFLATDPSFWDFSPPVAPGDGRRWSYFTHLGLDAFTVTHAALPRVLWQAPRWRYWIPEGDKLRTVGDHFRSVGGADIKSLIPGVGWVKVRRGT